MDWQIARNIIIFSLIANIVLLLGFLKDYGFAFGQRVAGIPAEYIGIALLGFSLWAILMKYLN